MVGCDNKRVNERVLEQALKDLVAYWLKDNAAALVHEIIDSMKSVQSKKLKTTEIRKLQKKKDALITRKSKLLDRYLEDKIPESEYTLKLQEILGEIEYINDQLAELTSDQKAKEELAALQTMRDEIERMVNLRDEEINETLFARITKKIVVYPDKILEFHLTFLPKPITLQYQTQGRGEAFTTIFDVITD